MNKSINILDKEYLQWVKDLCGRYRQSQIKAAVKINVEQLKFNWLLGRDIVELHVEERWGESVITQLSKDLREAIPNAAGLSKSNIYYCRKFYLLYKDALKTFHQVGGKTPQAMPAACPPLLPFFSSGCGRSPNPVRPSLSAPDPHRHRHGCRMPWRTLDPA